MVAVRHSEYRKELNEESNRYEHYIGNFKVVEESKNFFGLYLCSEYEPNKLITSQPTLKKALKLAKHMNEAYVWGYNYARELYADEYDLRMNP